MEIAPHVFGVARLLASLACLSLCFFVCFPALFLLVCSCLLSYLLLALPQRTSSRYPELA